jgi:hypothetical protein
MKITYGTIEDGRDHIREHITHNQTQGLYRVLDIGGEAGGGWQQDLVTLTVDIAAPENSSNLPMDICRESEWQKLFDIVERDGKFDYCICTHTLEDIYNPVTALELIPQVAKQGVISMPSLLTELSRHDSSAWTGYPHHRWVFDQQDGGIFLAPKLAFVENLVGTQLTFDRSKTEIRYEWKDTINYQMFMNNYLSPPWSNLVNEYSNFINRALVNINQIPSS